MALADTEVQHATVLIAGPFVGRVLGRHKGSGTFDGGVLLTREVSPSPPHSPERPDRERSQNPAGGRARETSLARLGRLREGLLPRPGQVAGEDAVEQQFAVRGWRRPRRRTDVPLGMAGLAAIDGLSSVGENGRPPRRSSGSKPRTSLTAANSFGAERRSGGSCPEFYPGSGHPMIVWRIIREGLEVSPFAPSLMASR
jgi:hypothetical protein